MGTKREQTQKAPPLRYKNSETAQTVFLTGCTVIGCLTGLIVPAFAGSMWGGLVSELKTEGAELYKVGIAIVSSFAAVALIFAFIMRMTQNPQRSAQATQWIIRIVICYVGINVIGLILNIIKDTASNHAGWQYAAG